jgi:hypothetical protein
MQRKQTVEITAGVTFLIRLSVFKLCAKTISKQMFSLYGESSYPANVNQGKYNKMITHKLKVIV